MGPTFPISNMVVSSCTSKPLIFMFGEDLQVVRSSTNFAAESTSSTVLRCWEPDVAFGCGARSGLAGDAVGWPWKLGARSAQSLGINLVVQTQNIRCNVWDCPNAKH